MKFNINTDTNQRPSSHALVINPILILIIAAIIILFAVLTNNIIFATNNEASEVPSFESNERPIDVMSIISRNSSVVKSKEVAIAEQDMEFTTLYKENSTLPKDEQVTLVEGQKGKEQVSIIKIFENDNLIEERIVSNFVIENPTQKIIDVGTSEFLAKLNVHLGDILYTKDATNIRQLAEDNSTVLTPIGKNMDIKLLELSKDWCRVSTESYTGYIKQDLLTSDFLTPGVGYESRKMKALAKLNFSMNLNEKSGLSLDDFRKLVLNEPKDRNKIFYNNIEAFYNMEQNYNINGIFMLAIAIHESGWGTSAIALDKKNLFGYGAYDDTPYESALTFSTYQEGVEVLAKSLAKYYLNPKDTPVYGGEIATASYYNGPTVSGVNVRYATDPDWCKKVYRTMEYLYGNL